MKSRHQPAASTVLPTQQGGQQTGRRILVNTGALTVSNLWRIVISFVLQILIARRLGVEASGQYTIALAYLNVCQVLSELGLPTLLVRDLAQRPTQRRSYFYVALLVQGVASLLIWGGLAVVVSLLPFSMATRTILWLVGASLPFYAITSVTQTFFQASERLELVMGVEFLINTLILGFSAWQLWHGGGIIRLVAILVITQVLSALLGLFLVRAIRLLAPPQETIKIDLTTLRQLATPFYGLALADVLLQRIDILLLSIVAGETVTGIYSAAYQFIRVLLKLVQSFWKALYPTLSRLHSHSATQYQRLSNLSFHFSLLALLAGAAVGAGVAQPLLHLIFGTRYLSTGPVFALLIWSAPLFLVENYAGTIFLVERRPFYSLLITGIHVLLILLGLPPLTQLWQATGAAGAVLFAGAVGALLSLWLLVRLNYTLDGRKLMGMGIAAALALAICIILPVPWLGRAASSVLVYALVIWQFKVIQQADWQTVRLGIFGRRA